MTITHSTTKELLWLSCREKRCCESTRVVVGGADIWRIATALELEPWQFTRYCEAYAGAADGFRLAPGGPQFQIVLAKRGAVTADGAPCFFLWRLPDGHAQCGLGELRPTACRSYPSLIVGGLLCVDSGTCTCRRWSIADLDEAAERALLARQLAEAAQYSALVEAWNARLARTGARSYHDFCAYVMERYSRLEVQHA